MLLTEFVLGTTIGNYTITQRIGEGGMGTVYAARHATLGRDAAVKVLLPELSNNHEIVTRFFNEAHAATAIRHPGIVEILDFGFLADSRACIVMELLVGESLATRCRRLGRIDPARALALVRQTAGALAAAHERGIVHRDLKPDNLFIISDPEVPGGERIKVLDFGIAKLASTIGERSQTQTGSVLGTPTYMAPEQCRGAGGVDARADLYSLGCVLYELVCGQPPFVVEGTGELIAHHLYFVPPPPRSVNAALTEPIERLILWLLEKEPAARPQTARELIDAIDRLVSASGNYTQIARPATFVYASENRATTTTTFSGAAGVAEHRAPVPGRRWMLAAVAIAAVTAVAVIVIVPMVQRPTIATASDASPPPPPPSTVPPAPHPPVTAPAATAPPIDTSQRVHFVIESQPPGAHVLVDGKRVGETPFETTAEQRSAPLTFTVRHHGYDPVTVVFDTVTSRTQRVKLTKLKPHAPAVPKPKPQDVGSGAVNPFEAT
ncbi:MAG: serine/threonine-protein kinase [Kofleriaceae bacterium]